MDKVLVINLTTLTQHVGVLHASGAQDVVQILPRQRVELRTGMVVDPRWVGLNPKALKIKNPMPVSRPGVQTLPPEASQEGEQK